MSKHLYQLAVQLRASRAVGDRTVVRISRQRGTHSFLLPLLDSRRWNAGRVRFAQPQVPPHGRWDLLPCGAARYRLQSLRAVSISTSSSNHHCLWCIRYPRRAAWPSMLLVGSVWPLWGSCGGGSTSSLAASEYSCSGAQRAPALPAWRGLPDDALLLEQPLQIDDLFQRSYLIGHDL